MTSKHVGVKTPQQLERHIKGIANHHRIEILNCICETKGGLCLEDIVEITDMNIKTASEHARRLVSAGLVNKRYVGRRVLHTASPYGKRLHAFLTTFSHS